jgi:hypothetical protein
VRRFPFVHIALSTLMIIGCLGSLLLPVSAQGSAGNSFYFRDKTVLYSNDNSSLTVIAEANLEPPNNSVSKSTVVAANIRNATTPFGTIWVGSVSWVSQPLSQFQELQGIVTITAWLSSDDSPPPLSGIGAGIAIIDSQNHLVGQSVYSYSFSAGSVLTTQVKSYEFKVNINRGIQQGQRFVFAVGLGATRQGWKMNVYSDSLQYPSRAEMPENILVAVSEPTTPLMAALSLLASVVLVASSRRKNITCSGRKRRE